MQYRGGGRMQYRGGRGPGDVFLRGTIFQLRSNSFASSALVPITVCVTILTEHPFIPIELRDQLGLRLGLELGLGLGLGLGVHQIY